MPTAHEIHCLQMRECRRADFATIWLIGTVRDQIDAELTLGTFGRDIDAAGRNLEAFGVEFEVMDQRFHRLLHFRALWRRNLAVVAADRAFRHLLKTLLHNADGLTHFFNADHEPVVAIAARADRNVKIHFGIYVIWLALADIPWNARATDHWT